MINITTMSASSYAFEYDLPYHAGSKAAQYNQLGKIPVLITYEREYWFDSSVIAEYIELWGIAPALLPADRNAALMVRQLEALSDGIMDAALMWMREKTRPVEQQFETELLRQREKISRALEDYIASGVLRADEMTLTTIAVACAIVYLNIRRVTLGWCHGRPQLVRLVDALLQRDSFARTEPPAS